MTNIPELPHHCGSWVIVKKGTNEGICEFFKSQRHIVEMINFEKFEALAADDYLARLNLDIKNGLTY